MLDRRTPIAAAIGNSTYGQANEHAAAQELDRRPNVSGKSNQGAQHLPKEICLQTLSKVLSRMRRPISARGGPRVSRHASQGPPGEASLSGSRAAAA